MNKCTFHENYPQAYFLENNIKSLQQYLSPKKWFLENEVVKTIEVAGEGNMNCTLRVITNHRSFIIKQSRPWVEKYSTIAAPIERTIVEAKYYKIVASDLDISKAMPSLIDLDEQSYILVLEDLGIAQDFLFVYAKDKVMTSNQLGEITSYLGNLHCRFNGKSLIQNKNMRKLNYQHMFIVPLLENNGVALDPELKEYAKKLFAKKEYIENINMLGKLYLKDGDTLLHGDYYPGSWLKTDNGIKIIDPEFCFYGIGEFDMGVMVAHLLLAKQPRSFVFQFFAFYRKINEFDVKLVFQFAGMEIMRRLVGVAQLPIMYNVEEKKKLLDLSCRLVVKPDSTMSE